MNTEGNNRHAHRHSNERSNKNAHEHSNKYAQRQHEVYVRCPFGLERTVASELSELAIRNARPLSGGVAFFGSLEQAYRACLWLRSASRVLLVLSRFSARTSEELYQGARAIPWQEHLTPQHSFAVHARGTNSELRNTQFTALRVKDALCDALVELTGKRPSVDPQKPDVKLELSLRGNKATLYVDLSGEPLHRRGYRQPGAQGQAPLKENLAAGILLMSGWSLKARPELLLDPLCGSGTLVLEAACIAYDRAPGLTRDYWGFLGWLGHDQVLWERLVDEANCRFKAALACTPAQASEHGAAGKSTSDASSCSSTTPVLIGSDCNKQALELARESAARLGLAHAVHFELARVAKAPDTLRQLLLKEDPSTRTLHSSTQNETAGEALRRPAYLRGEENTSLSDSALPGSSALSDSSASLSDSALPGSSALSDSSASLSCSALSDSSAPLGCSTLPGSSALSNSFALPSSGMIVSNPPYAHRLGHEDELPPLYAEISAALASLPQQWTLHLITPDSALDRHLLRTPYRTEILYNGKIETCLHHYRLSDNKTHALTVQSLLDGSATELTVLEAGTEQFAARLKKVARERRKWAKREGVSCYRLYDSDLPDYAVSIDRYEGTRRGAEQCAEQDTGQVYYCIAEYKAPKEIDEAKAERRYNDVLTVLPSVLGTDPQHVISKLREQARGGGQYGASGEGATKLVVKERDHTFLVDLSSYLDTGLFLDSRETRALVGSMAKGKRFLNLFAYTGAATVYAAAGGATATTTVDLSNTYLRWAEQNLHLNGFTGVNDDREQCESLIPHRLIRADVLEWVKAQRKAKATYDLIFVDPPTFSNSKKMTKDSWSVQRDHVGLLSDVAALLSPNGCVVFSCNLRSFKLDYQGLAKAGIAADDITASTIPHDFLRNPRIHSCYLLHRLENR